jgi:hypothetical protein
MFFAEPLFLVPLDIGHAREAESHALRGWSAFFSRGPLFLIPSRASGRPRGRQEIRLAGGAALLLSADPLFLIPPRRDRRPRKSRDPARPGS